MADTATRQRVGLPLVFDFPVQCWAGIQIGMGKGGSSGCHCTVEDSDVLAAESPSSLVSFCLSRHGYRSCPTWQAEKERIAAERRAPLTATAGSVEPGQTQVAGA